MSAQPSDTHEPLLADEQLRLVAEISLLGYKVRYVPYCEDARTPGLLGMFVGVTDRERKEVKISTSNRTCVEIIETLRHELHHVQEPGWDCGNRDVFGRGGPKEQGTEAKGP